MSERGSNHSDCGPINRNFEQLRSVTALGADASGSGESPRIERQLPVLFVDADRGPRLELAAPTSVGEFWRIIKVIAECFDQVFKQLGLRNRDRTERDWRFHFGAFARPVS